MGKIAANQQDGSQLIMRLEGAALLPQKAVAMRLKMGC
jgi:hypothetical protein